MAECHVFPGEAILGETSRLVALALREDLARRGTARFAISGGSAAAPVARVRAELGAQWRSVLLTWVDERCVDYAHRDSNRGTAYTSGALTAEQPTRKELGLWLDGENPTRAAARVADGLRTDFSGALDVVLLGMGADGHIASLFPGHRALTEPASSVVVHLSDSPKPPAQRMTLSISFLQTARVCFLLAMGESKREALTRLLLRDSALPASRLANLTIITDLDLGVVH